MIQLITYLKQIIQSTTQQNAGKDSDYTCLNLDKMRKEIYTVIHVHMILTLPLFNYHLPS